MSTFAEPILVSGIVQVAKNQHELQIPSGLLGKWFDEPEPAATNSIDADTNSYLALACRLVGKYL